ncbi:MAG: hypothetical protein ACOYVG_09460 [Bacteroidota bacterium]
MQFHRTIRLISSFYQSFLLFSILITTCCISIFWEHGFGSFITIFWFKIASLGLTYYFINSYKRKTYYYYFNLGLSKTILWTATLVFDFMLFLLLIILTYKIR